MNICNSMWHSFGQTSFNLAFSCYSQHQFFNWALVSGLHFLNLATSESSIRNLQFYCTPYNYQSVQTIRTIF